MSFLLGDFPSLGTAALWRSCDARGTAPVEIRRRALSRYYSNYRYMREGGREREGGRAGERGREGGREAADVDTTRAPTGLNFSPCQRLG